MSFQLADEAKVSYNFITIEAFSHYILYACFHFPKRFPRYLKSQIDLLDINHYQGNLDEDLEVLSE